MSGTTQTPKTFKVLPPGTKYVGSQPKKGGGKLHTIQIGGQCEAIEFDAKGRPTRGAKKALKGMGINCG